jgi:fibronectin-binding autotransporter adhesin
VLTNTNKYEVLNYRRPDARQRTLLFASVSLAALIVSGAQACIVTPPGTNTAFASCIALNGTTFSGTIVNSGTLAGGLSGIVGGGIILAEATLTGGIQNTGLIEAESALGQIVVTEDSSVIKGTGSVAGIVNSGSGTILDFGTPAIYIGGLITGDTVLGVSTFSGGIVNQGTLTGFGEEIDLNDISTFSGGVTNTGTITGTGTSAPDIFIGPSTSGGPPVGPGVSTFLGGIVNSGTITGGTGIYIADVSTFAGGITNSASGSIVGTSGPAIYIGAYTEATPVSVFSGGITNSGSISGTIGILLAGVSTFEGAIVNSGSITGTGGIAIDVIAAQNAITIDQTGGVINGAIDLSPNADVLNISGGAIKGNIVGSGTSDTVNFALGSGIFTYSNTITGVNTINFNSGTTVLNGTAAIESSESGVTTLTIAPGGTLLIASNEVSIGPNVIDNGLLGFNQPGAYTFGNVISGTGSVEQIGSGSTTLTGGNTYSGQTNLEAGALIIGNNSALGASVLTMTNGATLSFVGGANFIVGNNIQITGSGTFTPPASTVQTLSGKIADGSAPGTFNMNGAGTLILSGASSYTGPTNVNSGVLQGGAANVFAPLSAFTVAGGAALNLASFNQTIGSLAGAGSVALGSATLTTGGNNSSTDFSGTISGSGGLAKVGGGALVLGGANSYTGSTTISAGALQISGTFGSAATPSGPVNNSATFEIAQSGVAYVGLVANSGAIEVNGELTANGIDNLAGGAISIASSATLNDALNNAGIVNNSGAYNATVATNTGTINNSGVWTGAVDSNAGTINNNAGTWAGNIVSNAGVINNAAAWDGNITTSVGGTFNNLPGGSINGAFVNDGTLVLNSNVKINGAYTGGPGSLIITSVPTPNNPYNLTTGLASGASGIVITPGGTITKPVLVVSDPPGSTAVFTLKNANAISTGAITYVVNQSSPGNWFVDPILNTAVVGSVGSSIGAAVANTTSAAITGFALGDDGADSPFLGLSALIGKPANPDPNQWRGGVWVRFADGLNDISTNSVSNSAGQINSAVNSTQTRLLGTQAGSDLGLFNIQNTGWNAHLGVIGGEYGATSSSQASPIGAAPTFTTTQFSVPFVGIYGAVTGHGFFIDGQLRSDFWYGTVSNGSLGLPGATMNGNGFTALGSVGYHYELPNAFFVEPSAQINYSHVSFGSLNVASVGGERGTLSTGPVTADLGRLGLRVGYTFLAGSWVLQPYLTASVWHEFAGTIPEQFTQAGLTPALVQVSQVANFGQFGLGVTGNILNTGLAGYVRVTFNGGADIHGTAVSTGLRCQF